MPSEKRKSKVNRSLIPKALQIAPVDHFSEFIRKLMLQPRLTKEEEFNLAVRYFKHRDIEAAKKLVSSNLWLVVKIAKDYHRSAQDLLDLVQEGVIGLIEAVENFDPFKGVRFPTYAVFWIKAYIIKYLIDNYRLVRIGTNQAERRMFFGLNKRQLNEEANTKSLAELYQVSEEKVQEMRQRLASRELSLNESINSEGLTVEETLADKSVDVEQEVYNKEFSNQLRKSLETFSKTLSPRDREIFEKRVLRENKETLQELSNSLGLSIERVRQIENRIRASLKNFLLERFSYEILASQ
ncbi:MAG: sigma-70 family RNA polymerase sigma factor [Deltaproteobacteria bacterium]|nr:sigma-70 family RNA polymerase sigma factor [Deltaproteobacteria bacterium]